MNSGFFCVALIIFTSYIDKHRGTVDQGFDFYPEIQYVLHRIGLEHLASKVDYE